MKAELLNHCLNLAEAKVEALEKELWSMRDAVQSESKSTAGDKHETGRAMVHLEQEKLHKQIAEVQSIVAEIERIDAALNHEKIGLGSLVRTDKATFLIAAGLGKIELHGQVYFVVSRQSPMAAQLIGKSVGDKVEVNGTIYDIQSVE